MAADYEVALRRCCPHTIPNRSIQWQHVVALLKIEGAGLLVMTYLRYENTEREVCDLVNSIGDSIPR
jgi:hypothetical protein